MRQIRGVQIDDGPREEIIECPFCGERLDMRDLAEVFGHDCRDAEDAKKARPAEAERG